MERHRRFLRQIVNAAGAVGVASLLGFMGLSVTSFRVHADSSNADSTVQLGLAIAPVKLNLSGLEPALVGKGSYIVNAKADCNGSRKPGLTGGEPFGFMPGLCAIRVQGIQGDPSRRART